MKLLSKSLPLLTVSMLFAGSTVFVKAAQADVMTRSTCQVEIADMKKDLALVKDRFQAGEITSTDVAQAELDLLNRRLECHDVLFDEYCRTAPVLSKTVLDNIDREIVVGQRSARERTIANHAFLMIKNLCN